MIKKKLEGKIIEDIRRQSCPCHGFRDFSFKYIYFSSKSFCIETYVNTHTNERIYDVVHSRDIWEIRDNLQEGPKKVETRTRTEYVGRHYVRNVAYSVTEGRTIDDILVDDNSLIQKINRLQLQSQNIEINSKNYLDFLDNIDRNEAVQRNLKHLFLKLPKYIVVSNRKKLR